MFLVRARVVVVVVVVVMVVIGARGDDNVAYGGSIVVGKLEQTEITMRTRERRRRG